MCRCSSDEQRCVVNNDGRWCSSDDDVRRTMMDHMNRVLRVWMCHELSYEQKKKNKKKKTQKS